MGPKYLSDRKPNFKCYLWEYHSGGEQDSS